MRDSELRSLSGAEVMTWNVNRLPYAVSEQTGPLVVKLRGDVVKMFRWHCHPRMVAGRLLICDPSQRMRVLEEYEVGQWDEVSHDTRFAGIY